ncbi:MAG TPA: outer membrane protein [Pseudolabrys sp.]
MRRLATLFLATSALAAFALPAAAADLPARMPTKAPIVAPLYNWTGFYVGVNLGGSWGHQDNALVDGATGAVILENSDHIDGVIGGGQIGYNWQVNQWVFGLEADFQGSGQKGDGTFFVPGTAPLAVLFVAPGGVAVSYEDKLNWFGTVRGRLGWAFDRWMPYITGGWAFGHGEISGTTTAGAVTSAFSGSENYSGWTLGGGVEWAFYNNWSAKLEYLHIDFGDGPTIPGTGANFVSGRLTDNIVRAGLNYRFY